MKTSLERLINLALPEPNSGCWLWLGALDEKGYGVFNHRLDDGTHRVMRAHRAGYLMLIGEIPEGLKLDHLCRNRSCCNPTHLEPVTQKENIRRGILPWVIAARNNVCPKGHVGQYRFYPSDNHNRCQGCRRENFKTTYRRRVAARQ